jgi:hypothetical protein
LPRPGSFHPGLTSAYSIEVFQSQFSSVTVRNGKFGSDGWGKSRPRAELKDQDLPDAPVSIIEGETWSWGSIEKSGFT